MPSYLKRDRCLTLLPSILFIYSPQTIHRSETCVCSNSTVLRQGSWLRDSGNSWAPLHGESRSQGASWGAALASRPLRSPKPCPHCAECGPLQGRSKLTAGKPRLAPIWESRHMEVGRGNSCNCLPPQTFQEGGAAGAVIVGRTPALGSNWALRFSAHWANRPRISGRAVT